MSDYTGEFVLVDGLQRVTACTDFMTNKLKAFGHFFNEFAGFIPNMIGLRFNINNLQTRKEILQWYLDINAGGVVHPEEELTRVRAMLELEQ